MPKIVRSDRLRIEAVPVGDLYDFACTFFERSEGQVIAPITEAIALSHSKNPHAQPDDVGLLVAWVGDLCVGHQGLLPVRVGSPHGQGRAYWCTALYVLPEYRTKLVAVKLVKEVLALDVDCVLNHFTEESGRLFSALRFSPIAPLRYAHLRFDRLDVLGEVFYLLHKRQGERRALGALAEAGVRLCGATSYALTRSLYFALLRSRIREELRGIEFREVDRVRAPRAESSQDGTTHFPRGADDVNWTLEYPWTRDSGEPTRPPYYFPELIPTYRNIAVEVDNRRGDVGFVLMTLVGNGLRSNLKVRDFQLPEGVDSSAVFWIACEYADRLNADLVELPEVLAPLIDQLPLGSLLRKDLTRDYLFHPRRSDSLLATFSEDASPSLTDGDTAFF